MTKREYLHGYFYNLIGIHMTEEEINHIIETSQKNDTNEEEVPARYLDDCIAIRSALREAEYDIGLRNALSLWTGYSDSMGAGWVGLPYDDNMILDKESIVRILNRWGRLDKDYFKIE